MNERNFGIEPDSTEKMLESAHNASLQALEVGFGINATGKYQVEISDEADEAAVDFPAIVRRNGTVLVHQYNLETFIEEHAHGAVLPIDIIKIHVGGAIIPNAIAQVVNVRDERTIQRMLDHMTNTDTIIDQLNDFDSELGLEITDLLREKLMRMPDDDLGKLNGLRLAIGALVYTESLAASDERTPHRELVEFGFRVRDAFRNRMLDISGELDKYVKFGNIFRVDPETSAKQFIEGISIFEIAAAFPMEPQELALLSSYIHKNK